MEAKTAEITVFMKGKPFVETIKDKLRAIGSKITKLLFKVSEEQQSQYDITRLRNIATTIVDPSGKRTEKDPYAVEKAIEIVMCAIIYSLVQNNEKQPKEIKTEDLHTQICDGAGAVLRHWHETNNHVLVRVSDDLIHHSDETIIRFFDIARSALQCTGIARFIVR